MRTSCTFHRTTAIAAIAVGLLLPAIAAAAEPADREPSEADAVEAEPSETATHEAKPSEIATPKAEPTDGAGAAAISGGDDCDPLVSFTVEGTTGDGRAVAITAQALEQGVEGWAMVAWEAAEGTELASLTIVSIDGSVETRTEDVHRGSAEDVRELRFCGAGSRTADHEGPADHDGGPVDADAPDDGHDPTTDDGDGRPADDGGGAQRPDDGDASTTDESDGGPAPTGDDEATTDEATADEATADEATTDEATADEATTDEATTGADAEGTPEDRDRGDPLTASAAGDTEVMGVQLARTGNDLRPLIAGGALGAMTGAIVLLTARRRDPRGGRS
jgi:hypothetical protein